MENIHQIDEEMASNIINMIESKDQNNIVLALSILNNADRTDLTTAKNVIHIHQSCNGLHFEVFNIESENMQLVFYYDRWGLTIKDDEILTYDLNK